MDQTLLSQHRAALIWRFVFSACLVPALALANPVGETLRFGDVDFVRNGSRLDVLQRSNQAIIDWSAFSIENGEITNFAQPGAGAAALNRVTGISASQIDGVLRSNGRILLLNPNGIVIGPNGRVDTASFVASTLDVSDGDFLAGGDLPLRGASEASVINLGTISAFDGDVFLVAASVENHGSIFAPNGTAGLAAGNDVLIRESGEERVWVRGASGEVKDSGVVNTGTVEANIAELKSYNGNIYGMAVKNEGRVAATGVTKSGGQIFLSAGGGKSKIRNTGRLIAKKPTAKSGGRISIRNSGAESQTQVGGTVDASGSETGGVGGDILILGARIDILPDTVILADGESGGGRVLIGGGRRGENPDFNNAEFVNVAEGAEINAGATVSGDGGEVILFATDTLDFYGHASVRGGDVSGDGGFVELSGKRKVNFDGFVKAADTRAVNGKNGSLLFDPTDLTIFAGSGSTFDQILGSPDSGRSSLFTDDISAFLTSAGDLEILTQSEAGENGDISFDPSAVISWTGSSELRMIAEGGITFSAGSGIISEIGSIYLESRAGTADGILLGAGSSLETADGDITLIGRGSLTAVSGPGLSGRSNGIQVEGTITSTGFGKVSMTGFAGTGGNVFGSAGIGIRNGTVSTTSGNLSMNGTGLGSAGTRSNLGISMIGGTVSSVDGDIQITGTGGVGTLDQTGVRVGDLVETTGIGSISIVGFGGSGTGALHQGVYIAPGASVAAQNGDIVIEGTGGTSTVAMAEPPPASVVITLGNPGIHNEAGLIQVRGTGDIRLTGAAGTTGRGILMRGSGNIVETADGNIVIKGKSNGSFGIEILSGAVATNEGKVTYDGESQTGMAAKLAGTQADIVTAHSRRGDIVMLASGSLTADSLNLNSQLGANFDFSASPVNIDSMRVTSFNSLGSVKLLNSGDLGTGGFSTTGSIELETSGTLLVGSLQAGTDMTLAGEVITIEGYAIADVIIAGGTLKTGPASGQTSPHTLNLNTRPSVSRFEARGTVFNDVFNVVGAIAPSFDTSTSTALVDGGGGFDSLNINTLDLERTTFNSVEQITALGTDSSIIGKNSGSTYRLSGADHVIVDTMDLVGFDRLRSGTGSDLFFLDHGAASSLSLDDMGGIDSIVTEAGFDDLVEMNKLNKGVINSNFEFSGVEIVDTNTGNDLFLLKFGDLSEQMIGGEGFDRVHTEGTFLIGRAMLSGIEEIRGIGERNLLGLNSYFTGDRSAPGETFTLAADGSIGHEGASYLDFEQLWGGHADDRFLVESGFTRDISIQGQGGIDTLTAGSAADRFTVNSANAGNLNGHVHFTTMEKLGGGKGNDQFTFLNQATVESVDGGDGMDRLSIKDSNLAGVNTYTVTDGLVSRNPEYRFSSVESIQLFLGSGNDTVDVRDAPSDLYLDGGDGFDTLLTSNLSPLDGNPIAIGNSTISYQRFEAPLAPEIVHMEPADPLSGFLIVDLGDLLTLELGENGNEPLVLVFDDDSGNGTFLIENNFNENGDIGGFDLFGLSGGGAGFFGAAPAAAAALLNVGQAVVITVDGGQFLLDSPASLDGTFAQPSFEVIAALRESLSPTANGELARSLNFLGGAFLINQDGATAIDLSGPPPPALLALLQESLAIGAAQELAGALGIVIALPLTNIDGPTVIGLVVILPGQQTIQALQEHLGAAAENELQGALGN